MSEVVSCQSSVVSGEAADPLTDARCPRCGYSLRGLPENRCPECGRPFDPAEFTGTFLPRWPQLMVWYLAACIVAQLLEFAPALLRWNPYWLLAIKTGAEPLKDFTNICHLAKAAVLCLLGPLCVIGLYRRRDWARKGCIIIFALSVLVWLSYIELFHFYELGPNGLAEALSLLLRQLTLEPSGLQAVLTILFLVTGLRRQSLRRADREPAPLLSLKRFHPRRDWLLLAVVLLVGLGAGWSCEGWRSFDAITQFLRSLGVRGRISGGTVSFVLSKLQIAIGLATMATAFVILLRPSWLRMAVLVVLAVSFGLRAFELAVHWREFSPTSIEMICDVLARAATLMPHLALALFAFLAVGKEDIQRLEAPG